MDIFLDFLYFLWPVLPLLIAFLTRKRIVAWFARQIGPYIVQGVISWAFVTKEVQAEDGTVVQIKGLSKPATDLLAAGLPILLKWLMAHIKLPEGLAKGLPAGFDTASLAEKLPQLIMMAPGKSINIAGFKIPKELAAAGSSLLSGFLGRGKEEKKPRPGGPNPVADKILEDAMK
jgi:hypothetical protein